MRRSLKAEVLLPVKKKYKRKKRKTQAQKEADGVHRTTGFYGRYNYSDGTGVQPEKKFFDTTKANGVITSGNVITDSSLNLVQAGNDANKRVGRQITIKSIHIRGQCSNNADIPSDHIRVVVYWDQQCNGATATIGDLFTNGHQGRASVDSFLKLENSKRFKILRDMQIDLDTNSVSNPSASTPKYSVKIEYFQAHISCNICVEFSGTTGAITEIKNNNIGIAVLSHQTTSSIGYTARIRYTDF